MTDMSSRAASIRRTGEPFSIAYMDCDNFKLVNDRFGHIQGDALLCGLVETIQENARPSDTVARLGGDEFAILLPQADSAHAGEIAKRLQQKIQLLMNGNNWPATVSLGVATFRKPPVSPEEALSACDALMYQAKGAGKGKVVLGVIEGTAA